MTLQQDDKEFRKLIAKKKSSIEPQVFVDALNESEKDEWPEKDEL